jgi:hypothetical protein
MNRRRVAPAERFALGILGGLALLCLFFGGIRHSLSRQIEAELDALRADGFAVTLEEVIAAYGRPPPGPNAAAYWKAADALWNQPATAHLERVPFFGRPAIESGAPMRNDVFKASTAFVQSNEAFRQQVDLALAVEPCHLGLDLAQGPDLAVQYASAGLRAARMLRLEAALAARDGRPEDALALLESALTIGDHLDDAPMIFLSFVAADCDRLMVDGLEDAMRFEIPSEAWLRRLRERLHRNPPARHRVPGGVRQRGLRPQPKHWGIPGRRRCGAGCHGWAPKVGLG